MTIFNRRYYQSLRQSHGWFVSGTLATDIRFFLIAAAVVGLTIGLLGNLNQ